MQAALRDVSIRGPHSPSFAICQRVLHTCHEIIFNDIPPPITGPYGGLALHAQSRFARRKVKHHLEPAVVGIGLVLAGAPGMPRLTEVMGEVAVEQGRAGENSRDYKSIESQEDDIVLGSSLSQIYSRQEAAEEDGDNDDNPESDDTDMIPPVQLGDPPKPAVRRLVGPAQTVPALPLHLRDVQRSPASEDPLGQNDVDPVVLPYLSTPSISSTRPTPRTSTINRADALLEAYDTESQCQLLRSHYCRSEVSRKSPAHHKSSSHTMARSNLSSVSRTFATDFWLFQDQLGSVLSELSSLHLITSFLLRLEAANILTISHSVCSSFHRSVCSCGVRLLILRIDRSTANHTIG